MKKFILLLLLGVLSVTAAACSGTKTENAEKSAGTAAVKNEADLIPDVMLSENGKYEIGFCCANAGLKDNSFSEGTFNGVKLYAGKHGISYKYYLVPSEATDEDYYDALKAAVDGGAKIVLCASYNYGSGLTRIAKEKPEVRFVFIDGWAIEDCDNVAAVTFTEQECGFLAGYAAVREGYRKLGFTGGGGGTNTAVNRYGYGYVQGAEVAAAELQTTVQMNYSYQYGSNFNSSPEMQAMCNAWYDSGTEVIFSCGGQIFSSVAAAAAENDAYVIGVDSDQSSLSRTVITSAMKRVDLAAEAMLEVFYSGAFEQYAGKNTLLSVRDDAVCLPVDTWRMKNFTVEEYQAFLEKLKNNAFSVDEDYSRLGSTEHVQLRQM